MEVSLGSRASRPLGHLWACGPLAGGTPALPGTAAPVLSLPSRRTGKASGRGDGPWRLRQGSSRTLGARASRPLEHLWACGPLAGGTPALPGTAAPVLSLPSRRTGKASGRGDGPWRLRQGSSRTPGARASRPLGHLWACGPLAGGTPALPGTAAPPARHGTGTEPRIRGSHWPETQPGMKLTSGVTSRSSGTAHHRRPGQSTRARRRGRRVTCRRTPGSAPVRRCRARASRRRRRACSFRASPSRAGRGCCRSRSASSRAAAP